MKRALTLIEVIVALALGATLLLAVQALAVGARRSSAALESRLRITEGSAWPRELPTADLRQLASLDGLTLKDGVFTISGLNSCLTDRDAPRHRVEIRYRTASDGVLREERELEDEAPWRGLSLPWKKLDVSIHDGQNWQRLWPSTLYRPPRAVQFTATGADGVRAAFVVPLGALAWRRHDE